MLRLPSVLRGGPLAAAILIATLVTSVSGARAGELRIGTAPSLPRGARLLAGGSSVSSMQLTVALEPRDPFVLAAYAGAVSSPSSPQYRHFLTTAQFRARFAPTAGTVSAVRRSLRAHGLRVGRVDASGLALHVRANDAAVEHAFHLTLARVRLRGGRDAIYNVQAPAVDARVAPYIQAVIGLSTLYPARTALQRTGASGRATWANAQSPGKWPLRTGTHRRAGPLLGTGGPQACSRAVNEAPGYGGYTAGQIASYYDFAPLYRAGDKGQGVTVALYELEPNSPADIAVYQRCYGTHTQISYVKVDGGAGAGSGSGEAALDIDQFIGLAPKVKLLVYQGPNSNSGAGPYDVYAAIANQDRAQVISSSWGNCEPQETASAARAEQTVFEQMAVQGQTMVVAAGDSGSEDCFIAGSSADNSLEVDDPASQSFVTSVGGTSLELGSFNLGGVNNPLYPNPNPPETVWNNSYPGLQYHGTWGIAPGAAGGGVSKLWPMPTYQSAAFSAAPWLAGAGAESSGASCNARPGSYCREVPDVSANADPMDGYMSYWNGHGSNGHALSGWQSVGGTSAATPVWASIFALADASRACAGNLAGFVNPALYGLASSSQSTYTSDFNDVTDNAINPAGNSNDLLSSGNTTGFYQAGAGYDMATGLGSPHAANLVAGLCTRAPRLHTVGARRSFVGANVRLQLKLALPVGSGGGVKVGGRVSYSANHLPRGLHLDRGTGLVTGRITAAGIYDTVLGGHTVTGEYGARTYVWSVARRPALSALSLRGLAGGRPLLSFTVRAGQFESSLRRVTVQLPVGISLIRPLHGISVIGAAGHPVPHRLTVVRGRLTVSFKPAHSPVRIIFGAGTLGASRTVLADRLRPVRLVVGIVDATGHATTVTRSVVPSSTA